MLNIATSTAERKTCLQEPEAGDIAELPPGFDPLRFPIISRHFLGIDPAHTNGRAAAALDEIRQ